MLNVHFNPFDSDILHIESKFTSEWWYDSV